MEKAKEIKYQRLYAQLESLLKKSPTVESQLATINAILYHKIQYIFWVGFYKLDSDRLIIGPYQGPLACQELQYHQGVCWSSVISRCSLIVPDVNQFPGHIACDSRSKSEIVIPIIRNDKVFGVLDVDSDKFNSFNSIDEAGLKKITDLILLP